MVTHQEVGRRIRQAREALGLSQADLSSRLTPPRTRAAVSDIERGQTKLDVEDLSELARLLDKDLAYFYDVQPEPGVVYRRGDRGMAPEQQQQTDRALEEFKERARQQARKVDGRKGK